MDIFLSHCNDFLLFLETKTETFENNDFYQNIISNNQNLNILL